jgi:hypothetical protein
LGQQRALTNEEEVSGREDGCRIGIHQATGIRSIQSRNPHAPALGCEGLRNEVDEMTTVGKQLRKSALLYHDSRFAAGGWHPKDGNIAWARGEQDRSVTAPRASPATGRSSQRLQSSCREIEALELTCREEANRPAIRRPEWERRIVCSEQGPRRHCIE